MRLSILAALLLGLAACTGESANPDCVTGCKNQAACSGMGTDTCEDACISNKLAAEEADCLTEQTALDKCSAAEKACTAQRCPTEEAALDACYLGYCKDHTSNAEVCGSP